MGLLSRLFGPRSDAKPVARASDSNFVRARLTWRADATMPIPDWADAVRAQPSGDDKTVLDAYWTDAATQWLDRLKAQLGDSYGVRTSPHFMMLSALGTTLAPLELEVCERAREQILRTLVNIAKDEGFGPYVVLAFATQDEYYAYIDNYYREPGVYATSGGMFLNEGYGHFAFPSEATWEVEPTIGHELTHCLVSHLPLPAWLSEGMAVTMEKHLNPARDNPRYAMFSPREMKEKRAKFWNADTIQEFWSGKAYLRPDEGSSLSYDLGECLVRLISSNYAAFTAFANAATFEDAGARAAIDKMGLKLEDGVAAILGDGEWRPDPARWNKEIERGQFQATPSRTEASR